MSSCSFASFLQFRNNNPHSYAPRSDGPSSFVAPPLVSPLDLSDHHHHHHPSSSPFSPTGSNCSSSSLGSDSASPHKRHRAHSPDPGANSYPSLASFSTEFGTSFPFSSQGGGRVVHLPSVESVIASPVPTPLPVRSILCASSSPPSSAVDTPLSSPPPTRPVSRRSSTSKSVRFARCTNASVFPTHSTDEYDRSPIVPTCEAQSLELKRSCSAEGDAEGGGWIKCVEREKAAAATAAAESAAGAGGGFGTPKLPKNAPSLENPVEGVHGLIEGGFFVGEERDQLADAAHHHTVVVTGIPGVGVITEDIELEDEALELEDEMLVDDSTETVDHDDRDVIVRDQDTPRRGSVQDDSASSSEDDSDHLHPRGGGGGPYGSASSCASSSTSSIGHVTRGDSASPDMSATTVDDDSGDERERVVREDKERERSTAAVSTAALKKKQRFGLCSLGKYTRQDVFGTHDSLGGF
ncbi:hypothetical protein JCM11491_002692 [Sporobolomyces phaffii]